MNNAFCLPASKVRSLSHTAQIPIIFLSPFLRKVMKRAGVSLSVCLWIATITVGRPCYGLPPNVRAYIRHMQSYQESSNSQLTGGVFASDVVNSWRRQREMMTTQNNSYFLDFPGRTTYYSYVQCTTWAFIKGFLLRVHKGSYLVPYVPLSKPT